jgi:carboxylesterase type B
MMAYWLNFAYTQNPNGGGLPDWPTHNYPSNANSLLFAPNNVNVIQDTFREDRIAVFNDPQYADALCA